MLKRCGAATSGSDLVGLLDKAWRYSPLGFDEITDPLTADADRPRGSHQLEQAGYREQTWFGADAGAAFRLELWAGEATPYPFLVRALMRRPPAWGGAWSVWGMRRRGVATGSDACRAVGLPLIITARKAAERRHSGASAGQCLSLPLRR